MTTRSDAMRDVVAAIAPELKSGGFRKRRNSFNRTTGPGVVQVIDFQMAAFRVPPGEPVPPGLVDGSFRIELGVYHDDPSLEPWEQRDGKWVSAPYCQNSVAIGELLVGTDHDRRAIDPLPSFIFPSWDPSTDVDIWWSLRDVGLAIDAARSALHDHALPWLADTSRRTTP